MHSFVNKALACHLNWEGRDLLHELYVSTHLGRTIVASRYVLNCDIQVSRDTLEGDLILMTFEDYDLILGRDWLSKYGA
jgi:hypothetical protein